MILKNLQISNYGIFNGIHEIDFAQPSIKSVTLVGGLNGSGKTTIFEAIQICLFGAQSNLHKEQKKKKNISYSKYLESKINRSTKPSVGSAINLTINLADDLDIDGDIQIRRVWEKASTGTVECLEVMIDGVIDLDLTENWIEFISQIISPSLSKLFLFDGEKILHFAEPENTSALLIQGIQILLGADLITNLEDDLRLLKRNILKKTDQKSEHQLAGLEEAVNELKKEKVLLEESLLKAARSLADEQESFEKIQSTFELSGLKISEKVLSLEKEIISLTLSIESLIGEQEDLVAGSLPLELVANQIKQIEAESNAINEFTDHKKQTTAWKQRDQKFLGILKKESELDLYNKLKESLAENIDEELKSLPAEQLNQYLSSASDMKFLFADIDKDRAIFKENISKLLKLKHELEQNQKSLLRAPGDSESKKLFNQRDISKKSIFALEISIAEIKKKIIKIDKDLVIGENRFKRQFEETVDSLQASSIQKKQLEKIKIAEKALEKFSRQVVARSLDDFEHLITKKFKYLIRKESLVERFIIDKESYLISALNSKGNEIPLRDLSAGEGQILAISILWSLSEVSNIKIPVIIDTPLGRLDSKHRNQLITKYFPEASLQTIILSTDEEIIGKYYKSIKSYVGAEYLCKEHPKDSSAGVIVKGYF